MLGRNFTGKCLHRAESCPFQIKQFLPANFSAQKSLANSQEIMCLNIQRTPWLLGNKGSCFIGNVILGTSAQANAHLSILTSKTTTLMIALHPITISEAVLYLPGPQTLLREGANERITTLHQSSKHFLWESTYKYFCLNKQNVLLIQRFPWEEEFPASKTRKSIDPLSSFNESRVGKCTRCKYTNTHFKSITSQT